MGSITGRRNEGNRIEGDRMGQWCHYGRAEERGR
jgi:hypothetical protein